VLDHGLLGAGAAGKALSGHHHPDDLERSLAGLQAVRSGQDFESEKRYLRPDGRVVWVAISTSSVHDQEGQPRYFITQTQDITERKRFEERLSELADHDSQTGLWNRRRFQAELERAVWEVRRRGDHAALLILDIDHLKYINDSFGHRFGDGAIEHVGALIAAHARYGVVARIGGNEFALIVPGLLATDARGLADDLVSRIAATPLDRDGRRFALSVSAGVVVLDARISSADDALVSADLALHEAKTRGRSRAALYSQGTRQDLLSGLSWSDRLSGALANDAFELVTQPIVDLRKREQAMVDVRLWMRGQDGTLIHPERLMQAAARFGDVHAIDRWAISRIAQTASTSPGTKLALRVAADTIVQTDLVEFVGEQFAATSAEPADLVLCIDDALVREIEDAPVARAVLEAIVHIADSLSVATIVEAVGTDQMIAALVELGVRYGQGPRFDSG